MVGSSVVRGLSWTGERTTSSLELVLYSSNSKSFLVGFSALVHPSIPISWGFCVRMSWLGVGFYILLLFNTSNNPSIYWWSSTSTARLGATLEMVDSFSADNIWKGSKAFFLLGVKSLFAERWLPIISELLRKTTSPSSDFCTLDWSWKSLSALRFTRVFDGNSVTVYNEELEGLSDISDTISSLLILSGASLLFYILEVRETIDGILSI